MGEFLHNLVLMKNIQKKNQNSKRNLCLKLKQYILANFKCYLNTSSTANIPQKYHEIHFLCYTKMKVSCSVILKLNFEVAALNGCVVILIPFDSGNRSENC